MSLPPVAVTLEELTELSKYLNQQANMVDSVLRELDELYNSKPENPAFNRVQIWTKQQKAIELINQNKRVIPVERGNIIGKVDGFRSSLGLSPKSSG